MCGILGAFGDIDDLSLDQFNAAVDKMERRGPDDRGVLTAGGMMLGHRRLSVIDLEQGHQPMTTADGRYSISFNGEIYNHRELRRQLATAFEFRTNSDTEVLLAAYAAMGERMVDVIEGMFAFVIHDAVSREIFAARDPAGMKPLLYALEQDRLVIASDMNALLAVMPDRPLVSPQSLGDFLAMKHVPAPATIFESVFKLPAGHCLSASMGKHPHIHCCKAYWRPQIEKGEAARPEELIASLLDTVDAHLVSDVPVGAFLSGGLDSSAIVWAMTQRAEEVRTFTVGFDHERNDPDLAAARLVARHFGTAHTETIVDMDEYGDVAERLHRSFAEPFADPATTSNYLVSRETRRDVKVVLSGDGGDELFFGYPAYSTGHGDCDLLEKYFGFNRATINALVRDEWELPGLFSMDAARALRARDLESTLPDYYLQKADLASMAASLELRTPFTHRPFIDAVLRVRQQDHFRFGRGKHLLRRLMRKRLPGRIRRRKVKGFSRPTNRLLSADRTRYIADRLSDMPLLDARMVEQVLSRFHESGHDSSLVWRLLVLAWWWDEHEGRGTRHE